MSAQSPDDEPTYELEDLLDCLDFCAEGEHRLTKLELAYLCAEALQEVDRSDCVWCGVHTSEIGEWYMVHDEIWDRHGPVRGCLCIGCLEDRVGRRLRPEDFTDAPINGDRGCHQSERLRDRLGITAQHQGPK